MSVAPSRTFAPRSPTLSERTSRVGRPGMPRHIVTLPRTPGMEFDIVSYGRRGPGTPDSLSVDQIEQVKRTVNRTPEVMVKVSGGARDTGGVRAHLKYIDRHGKLD